MELKQTGNAWAAHHPSLKTQFLFNKNMYIVVLVSKTLDLSWLRELFTWILEIVEVYWELFQGLLNKALVVLRTQVGGEIYAASVR